MSQSLEKMIKKMPKIELHAHLNGCIPRCLLEELIIEKYKSDEELCESIRKQLKSEKCSYNDFFDMLTLMYEMTTKKSVIQKMTYEVIKEFENDNVIYLELRSIPKNNEKNNITKEEYVKAMLNGRKKYFEDHPNSKIIVNIILGINRKESNLDALETVDIAIKYKSLGIVGLDLCGDPEAGKFKKDWLLAFEKARHAGLKVTLHVGEIPDMMENYDLLHFLPARVGHMCYSDDYADKFVINQNICIEIGLTSNFITNLTPNLKKHHFLKYYKLKHPMVLCTDDSGIFSTDLSREFCLAAENFNLSKYEIIELSENAIDFIFGSDETKKILKKHFDNFKNNM